jgi:ABC-type transport system substrate-binding protein
LIVEQRQHIQERRFPGAGRTHQSNELALLNPKVDAALDAIRVAPDDATYKAGVESFQRAIVDDPPAIFLAFARSFAAVPFAGRLYGRSIRVACGCACYAADVEGMTVDGIKSTPMSAVHAIVVSASMNAPANAAPMLSISTTTRRVRART